MEDGVVLHADEDLRGDGHALLRQRGSHVVHVLHAGHEVLGDAQLTRVARDARIAGIARAFRRREGMRHLPRRRAAVRRIQREQFVQYRGAGTWHSHDHERMPDRRLEDRGFATQPVLQSSWHASACTSIWRASKRPSGVRAASCSRALHRTVSASSYGPSGPKSVSPVRRRARSISAAGGERGARQLAEQAVQRPDGQARPGRDAHRDAARYAGPCTECFTPSRSRRTSPRGRAAWARCRWRAGNAST